MTMVLRKKAVLFDLGYLEEERVISIGNRMNASTFRDLWARAMF